MLILNSLKESVERPGVVGSRGLLAEVGYLIWKNRSMRLGVVESCELHSHHQNGEVLRGKTTQREMEQVNAIGGWLSAWKSSLRTAKRPGLDWTQTGQDRKFPRPSKTVTAVQSSVSQDFGNVKTDEILVLTG